MEISIQIRDEIFDGIEYMLVEVASRIQGYMGYTAEQDATKYDRHNVTFRFHDSVNQEECKEIFKRYIASLAVIT